MNSIISSKRVCYLTGDSDNLHKHHILNGPLRDWAEKEGLWVCLSEKKHRELHDKDPSIAKQLKRIAQYYYEQSHSRDEWMSHVHKNYLITEITDAEKEKYNLLENTLFYDASANDIECILNITTCSTKGERND